MTYVLQYKALPGDPANPSGEAPAPIDEAMQPEKDPAAPRWAGDLYEEGDESSPEDTRWALQGEDGAEAWLDASPDGTLVGWVRDVDGSVFRYTDAEAWAVDVDDAGMTRTGADGPTGDETDTGEEMPPEEDGSEMDDAGAELEEEPVDGEEPVEGEEPEADPEEDEWTFGDDTESVGGEEPADGESSEEDPAEEEDEDMFGPKKRKTEGKSHRLAYRVK